jgi:hypothetical protein
MALSPDHRRVTVPDNVLTREVEGTLVLLDIDTGRSFTLDAIGARVWTLLQATASIDGTVRALEAEFSTADASEIRRDVAAVVERLLASGLLVAGA